MKTKLFIHIICLVLIASQFTIAQKRNNVWCFGDSAGIDFNNGAIPITTSLSTRGSCVSYCDTSGQLQLYAATGDNNDFTNFPYYARVFNNSNLLVANGDSMKGPGWYKELILIPMPDDSMKYYLFGIGVTDPGFCYSVVDMVQNGGLGEVVQKNVLLQTFKCSDGLTAIKHANGRDWWIICRRWDTSNDEFYQYLVTPSGISNVIIQHIGAFSSQGFTTLNFSADGTKMCLSNYTGLLELYDFDRCTGIISNPVTIQPEPTSAPYGWYWGCEFSASGRFLYVSTYHPPVSSVLIQFDLWSTNPIGTCDTLEFNTTPRIGNGFLKRGPDQKIYFGKAWECSAFPDCYPYPDSVYNYVNMNLSVINYPDSLGAACGYAPFSFYLGGKRTYYGLPNNPDYDMPALAGSPCDTLVSINEPANTNTNAFLHVYYASDWEKAFINADKLKGKNYSLRMVDILGKEVYSESGTLNSPYFTRDLNCASFASGIYLITFETESEKLVKKMQVNWR